MRKLPPLNALRAFEAAARHASVTQAATELGVSHSAISQQIKSLEEYFGQPLFLRQGRRVELTDGARALLEDVRAAFDRISIASDQFNSRNRAAVITINATPSFAMRWLIPRSSRFQIENPAVSVVVETSSSDDMEHLTKNYDFIFRRVPMDRLDHKCQKVVEDSSTALLAPALAQLYQSPRQLRQGVLLHLKSRPEAWRSWFDICGMELEEVPAGPYYEHFFLSLQAAINGLGIAVGPLCFVDDDLSNRRLVAPFSSYVLNGPGFHALYPVAAMRNRYHRAFLEALLDEGKASPAA